MNTKKYFCHMLMLLLMPAALFAQGLQITNGAHLVLNGSVNLVLHNSGITNNGHFESSNSIVHFSGNRPAVISGNNLLSFNNILVNKPSQGFVQMDQDINVSGSVGISIGNILLNNHTLDLGTTGTIFNEGPGRQITSNDDGRVLLTRRVPAALNAFNPGNIGLEITTPVAPGIITIERRHLAEELATGVLSIKRSFTVSSTVNTGMNATVRFFYIDNELRGQDELSLALWMLSDINNSWFPLKSTVNVTNHSLTIVNLDHWNRFTAAVPNDASLLLKKEIQKDPELMTRVYPNPH